MTFTIVARCQRTGALGVATCTTGRSVGSAVPYAEEGVGAVATQATTNVIHGNNSLRLLRMGFDPKTVLRSTLALGPHPEFRQVLIVDSQGRTAAHTGSRNKDWRGAVEGKNYVVGGNAIVGPRVIKAVVKTFEESEKEPLHERLVRAIDAGEEAGGCNEPDHTAALLVVGIEEELKTFLRPVLSLRVDCSDKPTKDLREIYESYKSWIGEQRGDPQNVRGY